MILFQKSNTNGDAQHWFFVTVNTMSIGDLVNVIAILKLNEFRKNKLTIYQKIAMRFSKCYSSFLSRQVNNTFAAISALLHLLRNDRFKSYLMLKSPSD
jgi:hypothetical protein